MKKYDINEFIKKDNRTNNTIRPITLEIQTSILDSYFEHIDIKGKRILDLGACVGITGAYVLNKGAIEYTAVEVQSTYCKAMVELFNGDDRVSVIEDTIERFDERHDKQYDIVILANVLFSFIDYYGVLRTATNLSNDIVIIDTVKKKNENEFSIELFMDQKINMADENASMSGLGVRIRPGALAVLMNTLNFFPTVLQPHKPNVKAYSEGKYIRTFYKSYKDRTLRDLSYNLQNNTGTKHKW